MARTSWIYVLDGTLAEKGKKTEGGESRSEDWWDQYAVSLSNAFQANGGDAPGKTLILPGSQEYFHVQRF